MDAAATGNEIVDVLATSKSFDLYIDGVVNEKFRSMVKKRKATAITILSLLGVIITLLGWRTLTLDDLIKNQRDKLREVQGLQEVQQKLFDGEDKLLSDKTHVLSDQREFLGDQQTGLTRRVNLLDTQTGDLEGKVRTVLQLQDSLTKLRGDLEDLKAQYSGEIGGIQEFKEGLSKSMKERVDLAVQAGATQLRAQLSGIQSTLVKADAQITKLETLQATYFTRGISISLAKGQQQELSLDKPVVLKVEDIHLEGDKLADVLMEIQVQDAEPVKQECKPAAFVSLQGSSYVLSVLGLSRSAHIGRKEVSIVLRPASGSGDMATAVLAE